MANEVSKDLKTDLYDRIEKWLKDFCVKAATNQNGSPQYYADAASGLSIALQEIDRERYDKTSAAIWDDYQKMKAEHAKGKTELCWANFSDEDIDHLLRIVRKIGPGPMAQRIKEMTPGKRCYCSRCNPVGGVLADDKS